MTNQIARSHIIKQGALVLIWIMGLGVASKGQAPTVYLMDGSRLGAVKQNLAAQDGPTTKLVNELRKRADKYLDMAPLSVMQKSATPTSGSKHDYMSQAPYFWYDSSKPNGLPYMRRDGERNPDIYTIQDHRNMGELDQACRVLALIWYLTGEEKYAAKATSLLRYWFIEEPTKMNPNLTFAQAIPGLNDGRGTGIIESISLTGIADAAGLLQGSAAWTKTDDAALKGWYTQFLDWMLTSKNGNDEHKAKNNHGTWFLVQATDFALFTGNLVKAKTLAEEGMQKMDGQIEADGRMPLELARTNGLGYSTYNLQAWVNLSTLAKEAGADIWNYQNKNGAGIRTALDWLRPYAMGEQTWIYQQIGKYNQGDFNTLLLRAAGYFGDNKYQPYAQKILSGKVDPMAAILYGE